MLAVGLGAWAFRDWTRGPEFTPAEWREARAIDDEDVEGLAADAVESGALIGKRRRELRRSLGHPDGRSGDNRVWEWSVGTVNDAIGPGDEGWLRVRFDPRTGRSDRATADP